VKKLRFKKIDAFASGSSSGNPAAVIYLDQPDELSDAEMQQIARELKGFVSEVGFVSPATETDYSLCYFSSEREVAFCGHATIAILYDLVASHAGLQGRPSLSIATRSHILQVENRYQSEQSVYISAPAPKFSAETVDPGKLAAALKCRLEDLDLTQPIQIINAGLETLIVPMSGLDAILRVTPELETLNAFCLDVGADIVLLYSSEVAQPASRFRTRVFAPTFGYLEDPATGSGNSAFGYYLLTQGLWSGEQICLEQNGLREAPNFVRLFSKKTEAGAPLVWFGGSAVVKIEGQYQLG